AFDLHHLLGVFTHGGQVMAHHYQRATLGMPGVDMFPAQGLAIFIEGGVGFVEQQHRRLGQAHAGEQGTLQFAARQGHQRAMFQATEAPVLQHRLQALVA
ncbi:hypothetical protein P279_31200, partial [Rhodobacteraceae bacterium PD-2]